MCARRSAVAIALFEANPHETLHEESFRGAVRDYLRAEKVTEFEPLARTVRHLLPLKNGYQGDTPGICTNVKAICDADDVLVLLTCSKQNRPMALRYNLPTKRWNDAELPPR
jgi:hypothetical protein